ncbi:CpaE family protein [Nocardioides sp. DS6]|uniref:CpaE family protein n=1 Tax=Nocardioides eburneus TaxID=3231482 RepID=A0ABV3SX97_9ACTN
MAVVLVVAAGAPWEPSVVALLEQSPATVLLKRCVDVDELLAAAAAGQADVALVAVDAPGLDAPAVDQLRHHGLRAVAVVPAGVGEDAARARASRVGIARVVPDDDLGSLPDALDAADTPPGPAAVPGAAGTVPAGGAARPACLPDDRPRAGRVVVVWGPAGAPGRTTVAAAVAAELARRRLTTLLVDADPYGGSVAQQLGILDEVSGLLQAARFHAGGELAARVATAVRSLGPHLGVVTGLPRPDRWTEVRTGLLEELADVGRRAGQVVVDAGFSLEEDPAVAMTGRAGRNQLTLEALESADEVVAVGTADPVGLTRLARGLVDLRELGGAAPVRVVVNRMRPSLGWTEREIGGMVAGITRPVGLHFLPDDRTTVDKALVAGRTLLETAPDAPLPRAVVPLVDAILAG